MLDIGPDSAEKFRTYWSKHRIPYPGLADPKQRVAKPYAQGFRILKLGRMPLQVIVDREGVIRQRHDATSMSDIPHLDTVFTALEKL